VEARGPRRQSAQAHAQREDEKQAEGEGCREARDHLRHVGEEVPRVQVHEGAEVPVEGAADIAVVGAAQERLGQHAHHRRKQLQDEPHRGPQASAGALARALETQEPEQ